MSCANCMNHRPGAGVDRFTCPECKQVWLLANVHPGNYWETLEEQQELRAQTARVNERAAAKRVAPRTDILAAASDMDEMLEALLFYNWTARRTQLFDEECTEGWCWEDGSSDGITVIGPHSELPLWDDKCRAALAKRKGVVLQPTPRSEMAEFLDNLVNPPSAKES